MKWEFVKRENAADLVMILMMWALGSLLITRFFLKLMGWPTISFGVWHIAHVLWGGFFMLAGMIMLLTSYGEKMRKISAAIAGIGWGLFVDEIGKYLTKDNDYWFRPAIIFIYISFIIIFLIYRYFERTNKKEPKTLFYSIINEIEEIIEEGNLEKKDKKNLSLKIKKLLEIEKNQEKIKLLKKLNLIIRETKTRADDPNNFLNKTFQLLKQISYNKIFKKKIILYGLGIYSIYYAIDKIIEAINIATNPEKLAVIQKFYSDYDFFSKADTYMIGLKIIFDVITAILFLIGLGLMTRKKTLLKGLIFFQYGLLVNIFLSTVFRFYFEQFQAIFALAISIFIFYGIKRLKNEIRNGFVV